MPKSKDPRRFVTETFKTGITNPQDFFDLSNFYFIKLVLEPLTLRPLVQLQIGVKQKMLGGSVPQQGNIFELSTPMEQVSNFP